MLPDFPEIKDEILERLRAFLQKRATFHLGPGLRDVRWSTIHEGSTNSIIRADGERDETEMVQASAEFVIKRSDIPNMTLEDILKHYDLVAQNLAAQQARHMFATIDKGVAKVGNTIDNKGQGMSPETLFRAFEQIQIDFDSHGNPKMPQVISGRDIHESAVRAGQEIEQNSELKRRWDRLITAKREEWRAREASRELVG